VNLIRQTKRHPSRRRHRTARRHRSVESPILAALDLGSNNCRLLIARPSPDGFTVLDGFSRIVRLGEGVASTGLLSQAAMDRALSALRVCADKVTRRCVVRGRYVATEACRQARNGPAFIDRVQRETGLCLEAIPSREEAELTLAGCLPLFDPSIPFALTFDVGGGSTEILWVRLDSGPEPEVLGWMSLPYGVITLTEKYGSPEVSPEAYRAMVADIEAELRPFDVAHGIGAAIEAGAAQMLGTAGTVTTVAGVKMGLKRYNRSIVDGSWLDFEAVHAVSDMLVGASFAERASHACIGQGRAELVVAGCGVLEAVCRTWPAGRLRVADRGVREGILLALARQTEVERAGRTMRGDGRHGVGEAAQAAQ